MTITLITKFSNLFYFWSLFLNCICYCNISSFIDQHLVCMLIFLYIDHSVLLYLNWEFLVQVVFLYTVVIVVQLLSHVWLFATLWTAVIQASLSSTISWSLLKFMSIELMMLSNHPIFYHSLLLLPSIFPSIRVFSNESAFNIRWPKYWSFNFRILSFNVYSGMIQFRIDWFELLSIQETLKSLLQHHNL